MCLAVPAKIESIEGHKAIVAIGGARTDVAVTLTPQAKVGDYVLVHAGFAITVVDAAEAEKTFAILREMAALEDQ